MFNKLRLPILAALGAVIGLTGYPGYSAAQSAAEYFKGKRLTYIIATKAGGGYDAYGRLISKYMGKHLGAKFIVKNLPGAGHIIGTNFIYKAKPDGKTIGTFNTGLIHAQLLKRKGVRFDLTKMSWIGKAAADPRVLVVGTKTNISNFNDLKNAKTQITFGSSGVGSASYNDTTLLISALKLNARIIPGFSGNEAEMSILRGEMEGAFGSYSSIRPFVENGYGRLIFHVGGDKATFGAVPDAADLASSADGKSLIALIASQAGLARFTAGPPGIPADRLAVLRDAYKKALTDPGLLADAKKLNIPIVPLFGDDVQKKVVAALNQPASVLKVFRAVFNKKAPSTKVQTALLSVKDGGKVITFMAGGKTIKSKVSGSRTKVSINGAAGDRAQLQVGMKCAIDYKPGGKNEPKSLDCKGGAVQTAKADPSDKATVKVKSTLLSVSKGGKKISFKAKGSTVKSKVSGSRTKVSINGAAANRKALKKGMLCSIEYTPGKKNEPKSLDCGPGMITVKTALISVGKGGKTISFKANGAMVKSKVSGKRTKIVIAGADANRKKLKAGMVCAIAYMPGDKNEPQSLECN